MERKVVGVTGRLMASYCPISITGSTLMEHGEEGGRGHRKADGIVLSYIYYRQHTDGTWRGRW